MNLSDQEGDTRIEYVSAPPQPPSSVATGRSQTSQLLTHVQVTDYLVVLRQYGVLRYHQLWEVEGSLRELVKGLVNSVEADGLRDQRWLDLLVTVCAPLPRLPCPPPRIILPEAPPTDRKETDERRRGRICSR